MNVLLLLCRLALASVYGLAGATKLADRAGSQEAATAFGVPRRVAPLFAIALPVAELAVAAGLVVDRTSGLGATGALTLALIFAAAIVVNLARGRSPDCHCFGQVHSAPVGWATVLRNLGFAAAAALVVVEGSGASIARPLRAVGFSGGVTLLVAVLASWVAFHLVRQQGRLLLRLDALEAALNERPRMPVPTNAQKPAAPAAPRLGLPIGAAVEFTLRDLDGAEVSDADYRGRRYLFVNWSPQCGFCDKIAAELAGLERDLRKQKTDLVFVSYGDADANRAVAEEYGLGARVLLVGDRPVKAFEMLGTPVAYVVDEEGRVAAPIAIGANEVPELARKAARRRAPKHAEPEAAPLRAGVAAPSFRLPTLAGGDISLADLRGKKVLLLFSDPQCGACADVVRNVSAIEREHRGNGVAFVLVGRGDEKANRAKAAELGVDFPVALQGRKWTVAEAYGTYATPAAFLVDEDGVLAADAALGGTAIRSLLERVLGREAVAA